MKGHTQRARRRFSPICGGPFVWRIAQVLHALPEGLRRTHPPKPPLCKGRPARERRLWRKKRPQRLGSRLPCRPRRGPARLSGNPGARSAGGVVRCRVQSLTSHSGAAGAALEKRCVAVTAIRFYWPARSREGVGSMERDSPVERNGLGDASPWDARRAAPRESGGRSPRRVFGTFPR